jgi:hypothetical protein
VTIRLKITLIHLCVISTSAPEIRIIPGSGDELNTKTRPGLLPTASRAAVALPSVPNVSV